jgi:hypothetical protein
MTRLRKAAAIGLAAASLTGIAVGVAGPASAGDGTVHYWTTCDTTTQYGNLHAVNPIRVLPLHREVGYNGNSDPSGWSMVLAYGAADPAWGYVLTSCIARDPRYPA